MNKLKLVGTCFLIGVLISSCQIKLPFNNASEKLRKVATPHAIAPNEEIVIGEFQDTPYKVFIDNNAKSDVIVFVVDRNTNKHTQTFRLEPEHDATVFAQKYEKVIFQNASASEINVQIGLNKQVEGWRTQPVKEYEAE